MLRTMYSVKLHENKIVGDHLRTDYCYFNSSPRRGYFRNIRIRIIQNRYVSYVHSPSVTYHQKSRCESTTIAFSAPHEFWPSTKLPKNDKKNIGICCQKNRPSIFWRKRNIHTRIRVTHIQRQRIEARIFRERNPYTLQE